MHTSAGVIYTVILRVQNAPREHDRLTREIGVPTTCFCESSERRETLWAIESPVAWQEISKHLAWATSLVEQHSKLFRDLIDSDHQVVLHIGCTAVSEYVLLRFNSALLESLVRIGIKLEFYAGLDSPE